MDDRARDEPKVDAPTEETPPGRADRGPDEGPAPGGGSAVAAADEVADEVAEEEIGGGD